jgi:hypothetical protein
MRSPVNIHIGTLNPNPFVPPEEQIVFTEEQLAVQREQRVRDAAPELLAVLESALQTAEFEKHPYRPWHGEARALIARIGGLSGEQA